MKTERNIGEEILEGIREIKAHKAGTKTLRTYTLQEPSAPQVIRAKLQLSQAALRGLWVSVYARCKIGNRDGVSLADQLWPCCGLQNKGRMCLHR